MYAAGDDPYVYPGSGVLKNRLGITDAETLQAFELEMTTLRAEEPLPGGRFGAAHYRAVHRHLFQDVYDWAGTYRTVRTGKGGNWFCYPEYIERETNRLFGQLRANNYLRNRSADEFFAGLAAFLAEINAIHPFREGNGRAQLAFVFLLAGRAGYSLDMQNLRPDVFLEAMIESFDGETAKLQRELESLSA